MKKFTTFVVGPLTFIESDRPDEVTVIMGKEERIMGQEECRELYSLAYEIKFKAWPEPSPAIIVEEGEI